MRRHRQKHPLSGRYHRIKQRCYDEKCPRYPDWGGRGVRMADEWRDSFPAFEAYMMSLPHALWPGYSIDRIDNDGDYAPGNVRWSTAADQRRNQRNSPWPFGVLAHDKDDAYRQSDEQWEAEMERQYRERRAQEVGT